MDWLLKLLILWFSLDIIIIATIWYGVSTIKPLYPTWWQQVIVDDAPRDY